MRSLWTLLEDYAFLKLDNGTTRNFLRLIDFIGQAFIKLQSQEGIKLWGGTLKHHPSSPTTSQQSCPSEEQDYKARRDHQEQASREDPTALLHLP